MDATLVLPSTVKPRWILPLGGPAATTSASLGDVEVVGVAFTSKGALVAIVLMTGVTGATALGE